MLLAVLLLVLIVLDLQHVSNQKNTVQAFVFPVPHSSQRRPSTTSRCPSILLMAQEKDQSDYEKLRRQAERIKLQALQMDLELILQKIEKLENQRKWSTLEPIEKLQLRLVALEKEPLLNLTQNETLSKVENGTRTFSIAANGVTKPSSNDDPDDARDPQEVALLLNSNENDSSSLDELFLERSRYVQELFPAIARADEDCPTLENVQRFVQECVLAKKDDVIYYQMTSPIERVVGGYYIRGTIMSNNNDIVEQTTTSSSLNTPSAVLVQSIQSKLKQSNLPLQFFFINDPEPVSDEDASMGFEEGPVLIVIGNNATDIFYDNADPNEKAAVTIFTFGTIMAFGFSCSSSLPQVTTTPLLLGLSILAIQLCHELAHGIVANTRGIKIGLPTFVPSFNHGLLGAITPLQSPPRNSKDLFDFAIVGPTAGMMVSILCLLNGLSLTAAAGFDEHFPLLPVYLLKSSALGAGLIEIFLGHGILTMGVSTDSTLQLHPAAIAGYAGLFSNALALLPLGSKYGNSPMLSPLIVFDTLCLTIVPPDTDGGRIALSMFGRRGAYIVTVFTALLLCLAGIFGLDESRMMLAYTLYATLFQRELEIPAMDEVAELDYTRGAIGILMAFFVALTLFPMV